MQPGYTPIYTVGNHDEPRIASRVGPLAARTAALMLLTLPGTAFIYYGEELGMSDVPIPKDKIRDPFAGQRNRDPQRTPMQWDASSQAGFTTGIPWLPVAENYAQVNVETQELDSKSSLNLYKQLLKLRRESIVLRKGSYQSVDVNPSVFSYKRRHKDDEFLILLNFSNKSQNVTITGLKGTIIISTHLDNKHTEVTEHIKLRANEGLLIKVAT
jgi:alpha-glucosidase